MSTQVMPLEQLGSAWIDVVDPSIHELEQLAQKYSLHPTSVQDCLDPEHLPKFEKIGPITFVITRAFDEECPSDADNIQEITRKIAFFIGPNFVISVHRKDQKFLEDARNEWALKGKPQCSTNVHLIIHLLKKILISYEKPIDQAYISLEDLETRIFKLQSSPQAIEDIYYLKRRVSVIKRILRLSMDYLAKVHTLSESASPLFQDLKETAENLHFYADELLENINNLLNLHISLQSQKTNESSHKANQVMRVLTVFSVFFMPLNFITGIYGMNFEWMPELGFRYSYPIVLCFMLSVSLGIYFWFKRRGWLEDKDPSSSN